MGMGVVADYKTCDMPVQAVNQKVVSQDVSQTGTGPMGSVSETG